MQNKSPTKVAPSITSLWKSKNESVWKKALDNYWNLVKPDNKNLEKELNKLSAHVKCFKDIDNWYSFLLKKYFPWKYTALNRLATTTKRFKNEYLEHRNSLNAKIKLLFKTAFESNWDIEKCLEIRISGLGIAGRSGLLALLFPKYFATVDQFVAKNIVRVQNNAPESLRKKDKNSKLKNLNLKEAVFLIQVMREKAIELNALFKTGFWTPRKLDMALWGCRKVNQSQKIKLNCCHSYIKLRNKYLPDNFNAELKTIFILESPPTNRRYFYDDLASTNDTKESLFWEMMKLIEFKIKQGETKQRGLKAFAKKGYFLIDATYIAVNECTESRRNKIILNDLPELIEDLKKVIGHRKDIKIILIKKNICKLLKKPLKDMGFNIANNGLIIPYPGSGQQIKFRMAIKKII